MQRNTIISAALVVIILLAGGAFWAFQRGVIYMKDGSLGFSKEALINPVPALHRKVVYPADFPDEGKATYEKNVAELTAKLETDPDDVEAWFDLAIYYRMVGDHAGAIEVWEYIRNKFPSDGVSRHNLAEYYFHDKKDYERAESLYEESIVASPGLESNYTDLYDMYKYVYKQDTTAAVDILKRAVETFDGKNATQFKIMLGREYRDRGDKENARKYLTEARDEAQSYGDRSLATELTKEINAL